MAQQQRSVRLRPILGANLDVQSSSTGELYFDSTNQTIRFYDGVHTGGAFMATRRWTQANTLTLVTVPESTTSAGQEGQVAFDATHIYLCVAADTWVRAELAGW